MRKELEYFRIENAYGGSQDWFGDPMMKLGGCGAVTACDCCIYFDLYKGTSLYPYDKTKLTKNDYVRFGMKMKPFLRPRWSGIDRLELYTEGLRKYFDSISDDSLVLTEFSGENSVQNGVKMLKYQIDNGFPVAFLLLKHRKRFYRDYEWHWFLLTGYEIYEDSCMAKAVTYGSWQWLDFNDLWNTGYARKGGMICCSLKERSDR